jgi:hypothetical protein
MGFWRNQVAFTRSRQKATLLSNKSYASNKSHTIFELLSKLGDKLMSKFMCSWNNGCKWTQNIRFTVGFHETYVGVPQMSGELSALYDGRQVTCNTTHTMAGGRSIFTW